MDDKLKKIAIKLKNITINEDGEVYPQSTFNKVKEIFTTHPDYFSNFSPKDLLKLTFYLYSYKKTNGFDLGEKMLNEMMFVGFIYTSNNKSILTCDHCGGDAYINCKNCYGSGLIKCNNCENGYSEYCSECYEDEISCNCEDGFSESYCNYCNGDDEVSCPSCSGNGQERCEFCDGTGEIESESLLNCTTFNVCTWNRNIIINSELREGEPIPVYGANERMSDTIFLDFFDVNLELGVDLQMSYIVMILMTTLN